MRRLLRVKECLIDFILKDKSIKWTQIEEYPGYLVSNEGDVWSIKMQKKLKPFLAGTQTSGGKYLQVTLSRYDEGGIYLRKNKLVHRLVAETYVPNPDRLPQVNHKDGEKTNNCANNLEWCTASENNVHGRNMGLIPLKPHRRYSDQQIILVKELLSQNILPRIVSEKTGVHLAIVYRTKRKEIWKDL